MEKLGRFVYLPIEITVRELDAKLLLAIEALHAGCEVIIGQKWLIENNVPTMPPGLIVSKTMTRRDGLTSQRAKRHGYMTAAIDEEMPGLVANRQGLRWVDPDTVAATDLLLCVGEDHRAAMAAKFPEAEPRLRVVGNPRWDLLRPDLRNYYRPLAEDLHREFGRFILVNTNSGMVNSAKGPPEEVLRRHIKWGKVDPNSEADQKLLADRATFRETNFATMKELLRGLPERFPEHTIVLRPHPNEAVDTWHQFLQGVPRIRIDQRFSAVPWIMASEALVHTNCTTGVEAYALGRPSICVEPAETETRLNYLSHHVSLIARDATSALDLVARTLRPAFAPFEYSGETAEIYGNYIAAVTGDFATVRAMRECLTLLPDGPVQRNGRAEWRPESGYRNRIWMKAHNRKLMPVMTEEGVTQRLSRLASLLGRGPVLDDLQVSVCGDNVFHLHQSRAVGYWSNTLGVLNRIGLPRPAAFAGSVTR